MRARLIALLAALAVMTGACATVPGDAVATVNGETIAYERFERIVSAQSGSTGLEPRDAAVAQAAIEAGVIDRAALDTALLEQLQDPEGALANSTASEVPADLLDELYQAQVGGTDDLEGALGDLGVTEDRFREVFDRLVEFEIQGLVANQGQTGFPIDRSQQLAQLQQTVIQQLVDAEIAAQAVDELDVEVPETAVTQIEDQLREQLGGQERLDAAVEAAGFTPEDFDELIVLTRARQQALQQLQDPSAAQGFFQGLQVDVADRFGGWNGEQGQVVAPTNPV